MRIKPDELVRLAPRLRPYLRTSSPAWPDIVDAADWLRHDLNVSKPLWGDACLAIGPEQAAIALAIVSAKPEGHFTASPGSYFHGMVKRARAGNLNLARTIWGLRENPRRRAGSPPRPSERKGEFMNS
jgi:replication initiation protein RepC